MTRAGETMRRRTGKMTRRKSEKSRRRIGMADDDEPFFNYIFIVPMYLPRGSI